MRSYRSLNAPPGNKADCFYLFLQSITCSCSEGDSELNLFCEKEFVVLHKKMPEKEKDPSFLKPHVKAYPLETEDSPAFKAHTSISVLPQLLVIGYWLKVDSSAAAS